MEIQLICIAILILLLAATNGANDVSKGVATLLGSGISTARIALLWGTFCTIAGGIAAIVWGDALIQTFSSGYLSDDFRITPAFLGGSMTGALCWLYFATRKGWPVSTTHALLGGIVGAVLAQVGPDGLQKTAVTTKAVAPLLLSPILAILLCAAILFAVQRMNERFPQWREGCCSKNAWHRNPYNCADRQNYRKFYSMLPFVWTGLHWFSGGIISFARGLNDVPKIAAILFLTLGLLPKESTLYLYTDNKIIFPILLVTIAMAIGSLWKGQRVLKVLAHRVVPLDATTGTIANFGTAALVLAASPLGLPVSTTHVSTGSLMGIRFKNKDIPDQDDSLRWIIFAWLVTLPVTALIAAISSRFY